MNFQRGSEFGQRFSKSLSRDVDERHDTRINRDDWI